jgi:hypothetical protein
MRKWEYATIQRRRDYGGLGQEAGDWDLQIEEQLTRLGDDGWELISVVPGSSVSGDALAGLTTEELWIFKRPLV